jgi:hypothetical protein
MAVLVLAELTSLWIVSKRVTRQVFRLFLFLFRHRSIAVSAITLILFPGTVIHELSHLFTAEVLGVRTGKLTLVPESIEKEDIRVGSIELTETDPFRRSVIGIAPFLVGLIALIGLSTVLPGLLSDTLLAFQNNNLFSSPSTYFVLLTSYLMFSISNTMFSSAEDMKGVIPLAIVLAIFGIGAYIAGLRIGLTGQLAVWTAEVLKNVTVSLGLVIILNAALLLFTSLALRILVRK